MFEVELVDWLHTRLVGDGITKYDATSYPLGVLFPVRAPILQDGAIEQAISFACTFPSEPGKSLGMHIFNLDIEGQGSGIQDTMWTVVKELRNLNGDVSAFSPIQLTNWRIEEIEWESLYPAIRGVREADGTYIFGSKARLRVKER